MAGATLIDTALGWIGLAWSSEGLTRLQLPEADARATAARMRLHGGHDAAVGAATPGFVSDATDRLARYAKGEKVGFDDLPLDLSGVDAFRLDVYRSARDLAYGETSTYGAIAAAAGHPGQAREVGQALGRNPLAIIVPCHRVVAAGGKAGGFSAHGGVAAKLRLLQLEQAASPPDAGGQAAFRF